MAADLRRQRAQLAGRDIGQVGDQQVDSPAAPPSIGWNAPAVRRRSGAVIIALRPGEPVDQRRLDPVDAAGDAVRGGVPASDGQRVGRDVDCRHRRARKLARQRHRETARAGSHVRNREPSVPTVTEQRQRGLDDQLGLRPWRQHRRPHGEREVPELTASGEERDRLPPRPAVGERRVAPLEPRRRRLAAAREIRGAIPPQHVPGQHLRVGGGLVRGHPGAREAIPRPRHPLGEIGGINERRAVDE